MAIEVRDINKTFGKTPVLRDVSIDVASGSLTALLGRWHPNDATSGSSSSTTPRSNT
jgi:ABC-type multidrug transport system ATPase subunit